MIELAKPAIDVGLYTNNREAMLEFWQGVVHLPFSELLRVGGGVHQLRHAIGDSVLKINHCREPLPEAAPGGIRGITIATTEVSELTNLTDPDGNCVCLVPPGTNGIEQLRVDLTVTNLERAGNFYGDVLGLPALDDATFGCGVSRIRLTEGEAVADPPQRAPGYRYLTIQVYDVVSLHAQVLAGGGREGSAPVKLGDVAYISFVRDPDGNWLEISQRKSITGSLD
jgi:lactoylglutathione lyase